MLYLPDSAAPQLVDRSTSVHNIVAADGGSQHEDSLREVKHHKRRDDDDDDDVLCVYVRKI